jgi:crotonobetainyl-CoA:carnitine CoA-transferase CaiB-like acyl-CoA transferase
MLTSLMSVPRTPADPVAPAAATAPSGLPLDGLRVVDLTSVLMGPFASQILGDMGADVIKVEAPAGDTTRQIGPGRHPGMGGMFLNLNRSKRSICLDLKVPAAKAAFLRLVGNADVFLYNVRPQAMARLGLSWDALRAINPRLIYVGVFGFGQDGPYAAKAAYDDLLQGASTLASLFVREPGEAPRYVPTALADRVAGMAAVNAILAAVIERGRSGLGQRIDVPMFETMTRFVLADHLGGLSFDPPLDAGGYRRLLTPSRRPYRTRDGYICAMIYTDQQWRAFYRLLGREDELARDPRLASLATRSDNIDAIYREIEAILGTRTTAQWVAAFEEADIPSLPLHDLVSIFGDAHLNAVGFFTPDVHPTEGPLTAMREPTTWSRTQPASTRPAPNHGEQGEEILLEAGFTQAEIADLVQAGGMGTTSSPATDAIVV